MVPFVVVAVAVILVVAMILRIAAGARRRVQRNAAFLAKPLAAQDLPPSTTVEVSVPVVTGAPHAIWVALELEATATAAFELALSIQVGGHTLLDGTYPVTFDDEDDARGLPNPPGVSALNTKVASRPGMTRMTTTLRAFRFDAPNAPASVRVRGRLTTGTGVTLQRASLLVTSPDAPLGSGVLPPGMRATG